MSRMRTAALLSAVIAAGLLLPPLAYAGLVYWRFGLLKYTWYIPYEELLGARGLGELLAAPVFAANMTSGEIAANMFSLRVGELLLSIALGAALGLDFLARVRLRASCAARPGPALAVAATTGIASTLAASSTGILGCCGPALTGGLLALAGLSATTAQSIALVSPAAQAAVLAALLLDFARVRRRSLRFELERRAH